MSTRYHVLRSEYSPSTGLRQVILTRQAALWWRDDPERRLTTLRLVER